MAKSKKTEQVPVIKTNSALMGWLNEHAESESNNSTDGKPAGEHPSGDNGGVPNVTTSHQDELNELEQQTSEQAISHNVAEEQEPKNDQKAVTEAVPHSSEEMPGNQSPGVPALVEQQVDAVVKPVPTKGAKSAKEKAATKPGATTENVESYYEQYFKKPERDGTTKPVQLSEDKHWLLTVLIDSARREGWRLTLPDLIDNLIGHHISDNKEVVDKLIAQWKSRKNLG